MSHYRNIKKCQNLTVGHCDLDCVPFRPTFGLLIFHSLRSIYLLNLHPVALAVREIFTGVRKTKNGLSID